MKSETTRKRQMLTLWSFKCSTNPDILITDHVCQSLSACNIKVSPFNSSRIIPLNDLPLHLCRWRLLSSEFQATFEHPKDLEKPCCISLWMLFIVLLPLFVFSSALQKNNCHICSPSAKTFATGMTLWLSSGEVQFCCFLGRHCCNDCFRSLEQKNKKGMLRASVLRWM